MERKNRIAKVVERSIAKAKAAYERTVREEQEKERAARVRLLDSMRTTDPDLFCRLSEIAKEHLGIETLVEKRSDREDFHEIAVWSLAAALKAAYEAGANDVSDLMAATRKAGPDDEYHPIVARRNNRYWSGLGEARSLPNS